MQLILISPQLTDNLQKPDDPEYQQALIASVDYYKVIGFQPPWICYFVSKDDVLVGSAGYKGKPVNNKVEIAYGTFEKFRSQGFGAKICALLVHTALQNDPAVTITARTLPEENHSTKILRRNAFEFAGPVMDPDDGEVWEWIYRGGR